MLATAGTVADISDDGDLAVRGQVGRHPGAGDARPERAAAAQPRRQRLHPRLPGTAGTHRAAGRAQRRPGRRDRRAGRQGAHQLLAAAAADEPGRGQGRRPGAEGPCRCSSGCSTCCTWTGCRCCASGTTSGGGFSQALPLSGDVCRGPRAAARHRARRPCRAAWIATGRASSPSGPTRPTCRASGPAAGSRSRTSATWRW